MQGFFFAQVSVSLAHCLSYGWSPPLPPSNSGCHLKMLQQIFHGVMVWIMTWSLVDFFNIPVRLLPCAWMCCTPEEKSSPQALFPSPQWMIFTICWNSDLAVRCFFFFFCHLHMSFTWGKNFNFNLESAAFNVWLPVVETFPDKHLIFV